MFAVPTLLKGYNKVRKFVTGKDEGASLVEYGLLVGLIAVVCIAAIAATGTTISDLFGRISSKLTSVG